VAAAEQQPRNELDPPLSLLLLLQVRHVWEVVVHAQQAGEVEVTECGGVRE